MAHPRRSRRRQADCDTKRPTYLVPVPYPPLIKSGATAPAATVMSDRGIAQQSRPLARAGRVGDISSIPGEHGVGMGIPVNPRWGGPHGHDPTGAGRHPDGDRPVLSDIDGRRGRTLLRPDLRFAVASEAVALYPYLGDLRPRRRRGPRPERLCPVPAHDQLAPADPCGPGLEPVP